jgi:hypothetical protein
VTVRLFACAAAAALLAGCGSDGGERPVAVRPAAAGVTRLVAVGDGANGSDAARGVARTIKALRPDRMLYLGDVYPEGTAEQYVADYDAVYGSLAARTLPTPGNHEWPNRDQGYLPYWRKARGSIAPWYATRIGGWELLSLNSEAPHGPGSPQLQWLERRLARSRTTCRIAFWHRPRFSAGRHGDAPDMTPVWDALRGHAVLVLSGHDHDMQRLWPRDGLVEFVSGAGGAERYGVDRGDDRVAFADDQHYGALRVDLRPRRASLAFVASSGRVLDRSAVACRP